MTDPDRKPFDPFDHELDPGIVVLEAGAGTGKTWSLTALVIRLLLEEGIPLDGILLVTFTNKATDELRDRLRTRLQLALALWTSAAPADLAGLDAHLATTIKDDAFLGELYARRFAQRQKDRAALQRAAHLVDIACISTIHGFCNRVLSEQATLCGIPPGCSIDEDDLGPRLHACRSAWRSLIPTLDEEQAAVLLSAEKGALSFSGFSERYGDFDSWLSANRPFVPVEADEDDLAKTWAAADPAARLALAEASWHHALAAAAEDPEDDGNRRRGAARRLLLLRADASLDAWAENSRSLGADALSRRLHEALHGPHGETLIAALHERWQAVLVDEFQDTDPMQSAIFKRAFAQIILRCVGDPKQSIYRFRGADLHAYHSLVSSAKRVETMRRNFRSNKACVDAVNTLFNKKTSVFLDPNIQFENAEAQRKTSRLSDPAQHRPLVWWWSEAPRKAQAVSELCTAVASEIRRLMNEAELDRGDGPRPLRAGDCAVLTHSNKQAAALGRRLRAAGIPAILRSQDSVLDSPAASELEYLLAAIDDPSQRLSARAACTTRVWGRQVSAFLDNGESLAADLDLLQRLHRNWRYGGLLGSLGRLMLWRRSRQRILAEADGERFLTDLMHSAEILHSKDDSPAATLAQLRRLRQSGSRNLTQRLEDDGDAVSVMTVHTAKGLQWPVVFAPFLWTNPTKLTVSLSTNKPGDERPLDYHGPEGMQLDWRQMVELEAAQQRDCEARAEAVRQTYVALTRAEERSYVAFGPIGSPSNKATPHFSGLASIAGPQLEECTPEKIQEQALQCRQALWPIEGLENVVAYLKEHGSTKKAQLIAGTGLDGKVIDRLIKTPWLSNEGEKRGYYHHSGLLVPPSYDDAEAFAAALAADALMCVVSPPENADRQCLTMPPTLTSKPLTARVMTPAQINSFSGLTRGLPASHLKGALGDEGEAMAPASQDPEGIHAFPAGAGPGDCLHRIIEHSNLQQLDDPDTPERIERMLRGSGIGGDEEGRRTQVANVQAMLRNLAASCIPECTTSMGQLDNSALHHEWPFDMHLGMDPKPRLQALIEAYRQHSDNILDERWCEQLATLDSGGRDLAGWLTGFVDLIACIDGAWWIIDWKSNRLGSDARAYSQEAIRLDAIGHRYPLQWTIYLVALHRQLAERLPDYDPNRHIGGVAYCYLRGLGGASGRNPAAGWLVHRPGTPALQAWSRALCDPREPGS